MRLLRHLPCCLPSTPFPPSPTSHHFTFTTPPLSTRKQGTRQDSPTHLIRTTASINHTSPLISPRPPFTAPSLSSNKQVVKLDSRDTPPPLHFSPVASDRERSSTAETTPISTPRAFATGFPRKTDKENLFSWQHRHSTFAPAANTYVDSTLLDSDFEESTFPLFNGPSGGVDTITRSGPMDVATASGHMSSRGPSQLTSALQATSGNGVRVNSAMDVDGQYKGFSSNSGAVRTESQQGTAAQPISVRSSNRDSSREQPRRESLASSMLTGMSWGGNSVGSWIRDDIIMQGTSPFAYKSPSFHSASYLPKLEANFMRDFTCCGIVLPSLHDLLQHYEENHSDSMPSTLPQESANQNNAQPDSKAARATIAASNIQNEGAAKKKRAPMVDTSRQGHTTSQTPSAPPTPRPLQPAQQVTRGFAPAPNSHLSDDEPAGDMEMDDFGAGPSNTQQPQYPISSQGRITQRSQFGQPSSSRVAPLDMNVLDINNLMQQHQGLRNSQPATPVSAGRNGNMYHNNPTVSSVNTPTLSTYQSTHPLQNQFYTPESSAPGTPGELDEDVVGGMGNMNMNKNNMNLVPNSAYGYPFGNGQDMLELCIDEPAKRLFAQNGSHGFEYTQPHHSENTSATQLGDGQYSEDSQIARTIREEQKRAGVPDPSADGGIPKPFHCPVIGCEKAYKNQNGLKYHKSHGHNTQKLAANENGTFSIVDPETLKVYPGTLGMEKHKPYRCDNCGKRYKNLNGLKYHKTHSPNCPSEIQIPPIVNDILGSSRHRGQLDQMMV